MKINDAVGKKIFNVFVDLVIYRFKGTQQVFKMIVCFIGIAGSQEWYC